jgi:hypothetical protein
VCREKAMAAAVHRLKVSGIGYQVSGGMRFKVSGVGGIVASRVSLIIVCCPERWV